jgi:hypothetical protein
MFRVDDIAAAVKRVRAAGGTAEAPVHEGYGIRAECADDQASDSTWANSRPDGGSTKGSRTSAHQESEVLDSRLFINDAAGTEKGRYFLEIAPTTAMLSGIGTLTSRRNMRSRRATNRLAKAPKGSVRGCVPIHM